MMFEPWLWPDWATPKIVVPHDKIMGEKVCKLNANKPVFDEDAKVIVFNPNWWKK